MGAAMDEPTDLGEALRALPLFPLPNGVLLPYEMLPLHVFERRYRALVEEVLETGRPIGLACLAPGWEGNYEGRPALEPVCGVGFVTRHEKLPDGRYNILLRGVARVRLDDELPETKPFREARATLLADTVPAAELVARAEESVRRMLFALCASHPGPASSALAQLALQAPGPGALADMVIAALVTDLAKRQLALLSTDVGERLELAQTSIAEQLVQNAPEPSGLRN